MGHWRLLTACRAPLPAIRQVDELPLPAQGQPVPAADEAEAMAGFEEERLQREDRPVIEFAASLSSRPGPNLVQQMVRIHRCKS